MLEIWQNKKRKTQRFLAFNFLMTFDKLNNIPLHFKKKLWPENEVLKPMIKKIYQKQK